MTQLALAVDADDELWTLDNLPTPEAPYVEVGDELIEIRSRFPSSYYTLTGETLPPRIRVRRGIAGTTAASHIQGSTLTPNYGLGGWDGAGGVTVDNQSDDPELVTTLVLPGVLFGPEGTVTVDLISDTDSVTGAFAKVQVQATEDNGQAVIAVEAVDAVDAGATINATATSDGGAALVNNKAAAPGVGGTATARLDAEGQTAEAGLSAGDGITAVGVEATWDGTGLGEGVLTIRDGLGVAGNPGDVLTADASTGSKWLPPVDPLTSDDAIIISAADAANVLTLGADGSLEHNGSGVVRLLGLPSADPEVAGQLYTNGVPSGGVPQALMVSGGPA